MARVMWLAALAALGSVACAGTPLAPSSPSPARVRAEAGVVWASARSSSEPRRVWSMPARGPVEALALEDLPGGSHAVRFRQGGVEWQGELDADLAARGPLRPVTTRPGVQGELQASIASEAP